MSDGMLSQDEIDALLRGTAETEEESTDQADNANDEAENSSVNTENVNADTDNPDHNDFSPAEEYLSPIEKDALGEIGNISFGSSATALSTLLNQKVEITTPSVSIVNKNNLTDEFPTPYVGIQVLYTQGFSGSNLLVVKQSDAAIIADLMLGGDGTNPSELMDEIQLSAVQEAMNQMMGSSATSMSTIFSKRVDISPPAIMIFDVKEGQGTDRLPEDNLLVKISFRLKVGNLIDSSIMQLLPLNFAKSLVHELMNPSQNKADEAANAHQDQTDNKEVRQTTQSNHEGQPYVSQNTSNENEQMTFSANTSHQESPAGVQANREHQQIPEQPQAPQHVGMAFQGKQQPNIQPAMFSTFEPQQLQETETKNLNMLLDIPLQVTVELGSTRRSVKEILELSTGSIIELDKLAGEPVDILINGRLVAKGEVVVIDENFGVRVTDIISKSDRINKLGK